MYKPTKSNSMAGYIKQEMKDLNGSGKNPTCYRMKRRGQVSNQELARILARGGSGLAQGDVMHVLIALSEVFPTLLADGNSITIDGIGTFYAGIGLADDKRTKAGNDPGAEAFDDDGPQRNAQSLEVKRIVFNADKGLIAETGKQCKLSKLGVSRLHVSPYSPSQRLQLLQNYLKTHPYIRIPEYMALTGLSHTTAVQELKRWREDPATGLTTEGKRNGLVYVHRKTEEEA